MFQKLALIVGGKNDGTSTIVFLAHNVGSLIDTEIVSGWPADFASYAFRREENQSDIAGLIRPINDTGGITYDNLRFVRELVFRMQIIMDVRM